MSPLRGRGSAQLLGSAAVGPVCGHSLLLGWSQPPPLLRGRGAISPLRERGSALLLAAAAPEELCGGKTLQGNAPLWLVGGGASGATTGGGATEEADKSAAAAGTSAVEGNGGLADPS